MFQYSDKSCDKWIDMQVLAKLIIPFIDIRLYSKEIGIDKKTSFTLPY